MSTKKKYYVAQTQVSGTAYYHDHQRDTLLIFLHGWGGSAQSFDPLVAELLQADSSSLGAKKISDTLQLDLPGFGESDMPPTEGWTTDQYAEWFKDWFDLFLKDTKKSYKNMVLYGHSFGCRIIVRFLQQNPDWTHPIILTGAAGIKHPLPSRVKIAQLITKVIQPINSLLPKKFKKIVLKKIFQAHDWADAPSGLKNTLTKVLAEDDVRDLLTQIQNQTLLIWGAKDSYTPLKSGLIFAEKLPHAEFVVFPTGKHGIHYTHKTNIVKAITKFFDTISRSSFF